jgi:hypothetical protein
MPSYGNHLHTYYMMTFSEFIAIREGLNLPDRPPAKGLSRINPFPTTNAHRRRMNPKPLRPTVRGVAEIVPPSMIPKLTL